MRWKHFLKLTAYSQLVPILESGEETTLVGGQAVLEGVMMRAPHSYCTTVRRANGELVTEEALLPKVSEKYPIFKLPILRGIGTLGQAMWLGVKAMQFSTNVMAQDEAAKQEAETGKKQSGEIPSWMMAVNLIVSFLFFFFLYKFVPLFLAKQAGNYIPAFQNHYLMTLLDGVIRLVIFLGFMVALSFQKEIHRVFQYHGAEHKVVFNFESGKPVNVENAQQFVTWHPRCGTSFLMVVMAVSIAVYSLFPIEGFLKQLAVRFVMFLPIAGISFEVIRFAAKRQSSLLALLTKPGLWLQRITTQPPSDDQAEVAIHSLQRAMDLQKQSGGPMVIA